MTAGPVSKSLERAIAEHQPCSELIHHTDCGGQYAATGYRVILRRVSMRQNISRAGDCYDNASMESCFGAIKTELEMIEYESYRVAFTEIGAYISYYNYDRRHSSLGYLTPIQLEASVVH